MKKNYIYLFMILIIVTLAGCSKKTQMTNFIPTPVPDESSIAATQEPVQEDVQSEPTVTPAQEQIVVGQTTPMYVKLDQYGGFLNVRSKPSTDGEAVGFLVHAEQIDVIEISDGWASFVYNDKVCYVNADYLVKERPEYLDPPTPTPKPKVTPTPVPEVPADI